MNYIIDQKFLEDAGVKIADEVIRGKKIDELNDIFEERVGSIIVEHLTETQVLEFEKIYDENNENANIAWLKKAYPDYAKEVSKAYKVLKDDLKHDKIK